MSRILPKLLVAVVAAAVTALLVEGVLSFFLGRSLRPRPFTMLARNLEQQAAESRLAGGDKRIFRPHEDPRVGFVLRSGSQEMAGATCTINSLGVRQRPGPEPPADAVRIVVLGDSVAYGVFVNDDETLAHQLETILNEVRGPGVPAVAAYSVAVPGWNHRNAVSFLTDNYRALHPDIVIYMPVGNDLIDTYAVYPTGELRMGFDPLARDPLLRVHYEGLHLYQYYQAQRISQGLATGVQRMEDLGLPALGSDLTAESQQRYDDNAASIALLHEWLRTSGARLMLTFMDEVPDYNWHLQARLLDAGLDIPYLTYLREVRPEFTLGIDPHPNRTCLRMAAIWLAEDLLARGWVKRGAGNPLPEVDEEYAQARADPPSAERTRERARQLRARSRDIFQSTIDLETGRGCVQIYGGLNPDGTIGTRFSGILKAAGRRVRVRLAPLGEDTDFPSVSVAVEVDGHRLGAIDVRQTEGPLDQSFVLPDPPDAGAPLEVRLVPDGWTLTRLESRTLLASCRLLSVSSE